MYSFFWSDLSYIFNPLPMFSYFFNCLSLEHISDSMSVFDSLSSTRPKGKRFNTTDVPHSPTIIDSTTKPITHASSNQSKFFNTCSLWLRPQSSYSHHTIPFSSKKVEGKCMLLVNNITFVPYQIFIKNKTLSFKSTLNLGPLKLS